MKNTLENSILDIINSARESVGVTNAVTDKQWSQYVAQCGYKMQLELTRDDFNKDTMSKELERLFALPFARPAYSQQIAKIKTLCEAIKCKMPDVVGISNVKASEIIVKLQALVPATERQLDMITNYFRFGLLTDADTKFISKGNISEGTASTIIGTHRDDYVVASEGRLTLNQARRIIQLKKKLYDEVVNVQSLSTLTFEDASELISKLKLEDENRVSAIHTNWTGYTESSETRSQKDVDFNKLSLEDMEYDIKINIVKALRSVVGQDSEDVDADVNESNVDETIGQLYKVAMAIGEDKTAYGAIQSCLSAKKVTKKVTKKVSSKSRSK